MNFPEALRSTVLSYLIARNLSGYDGTCRWRMGSRRMRETALNKRVKQRGMKAGWDEIYLAKVLLT